MGLYKAYIGANRLRLFDQRENKHRGGRIEDDRGDKEGDGAYSVELTSDPEWFEAIQLLQQPYLSVSSPYDVSSRYH